MKGYEITERGKFVIIVLFVLVLVVLSFIISINAWSRDSAQNGPMEVANDTLDPAEDSADELSDGTIHEPVRGGTGQNTDSTETIAAETEQDEEDPREEGNGGVPPPDHEGDEAGEPYEHGLVGLDVAAGTMAFIFFHGTQTALDELTASRLVDFLASPRNTPGARIVVEIPEMPDAGRSNVINALVDELLDLGVQRGDIVFFTIGDAATGDSVEIRLSFHQNIGGGK